MTTKALRKRSKSYLKYDENSKNNEFIIKASQDKTTYGQIEKSNNGNLIFVLEQNDYKRNTYLKKKILKELDNAQFDTSTMEIILKDALDVRGSTLWTNDTTSDNGVGNKITLNNGTVTYGIGGIPNCATSTLNASIKTKYLGLRKERCSAVKSPRNYKIFEII